MVGFQAFLRSSMALRSRSSRPGPKRSRLTHNGLTLPNLLHAERLNRLEPVTQVVECHSSAAS
jgi:hypothetical protein